MIMELEVPQETKLVTETSNQPDLLFAWLSPIEKKMGHNENSHVPHSPFLKAKSAIRKTFRGSVAGVVPSGLRTANHKLKGACQSAYLDVLGDWKECMS